MRQEYSAEEMEEAREIALDVLTQIPPGRINGMEELKKIFQRATRGHHFHSEETAEKQKKSAWKLVASIVQNYDVLHTELMAYINPDELARHDKDEALLLIGLGETIYFHFEPRSIVSSLLAMRGNSGQKNFLKTALWRIAFGRVNDAVFLAMQNISSADSRDISVDKPASDAMEFAGLVNGDARRDAAIEIVSDIVANCDMLDDALERYLPRANSENIDSTGRNILRIGLYQMISRMANHNEIIQSMSLLAAKYKHSQAQEFINSWLARSARSRARAIAFQIIYALLFTSVSSVEELKDVYARSPDNLEILSVESSKEPESFAWKLAKGVWSNEKLLDTTLERYSKNWRKERIGNIELTLLRLGLYEILARLTPPKVVIMEILDLADMFGVPDAKAFINGILNAVAKEMENRGADN